MSNLKLDEPSSEIGDQVEDNVEEEVESNTTTVNENGLVALKKKKKNKKKKKKVEDGAVKVAVKTAIQQTEPPSVPVCKMYTNEIYPGTPLYILYN